MYTKLTGTLVVEIPVASPMIDAIESRYISNGPRRRIGNCLRHAPLINASSGDNARF